MYNRLVFIGQNDFTTKGRSDIVLWPSNLKKQFGSFYVSWPTPTPSVKIQGQLFGIYLFKTILPLKVSDFDLVK